MSIWGNSDYMRILFTRKAFEAEKTSLQASPQSFSSVASFHWPLPYVCPQGVLIPQGGQAEWVKSCRAASGVLRQQRRTSGWPGPRRAVLSRSVAQSCQTLCYSTGCSPPGSSVHRLFQARILEWLPFPPPGNLPSPGMEPSSSALPANSFPLSHQGSSLGPGGVSPIEMMAPQDRLSCALRPGGAGRPGR